MNQKHSSPNEAVGLRHTGSMDYQKILKKIYPKVEQVQDHLEFLKYFDEHPEYYQEKVVKRAITR